MVVVIPIGLCIRLCLRNKEREQPQQTQRTIIVTHQPIGVRPGQPYVIQRGSMPPPGAARPRPQPGGPVPVHHIMLPPPAGKFFSIISENDWYQWMYIVRVICMWSMVRGSPTLLLGIAKHLSGYKLWFEMCEQMVYNDWTPTSHNYPFSI